jgi:hypothetical protein
VTLRNNGKQPERAGTLEFPPASSLIDRLKNANQHPTGRYRQGDQRATW